MSREAQIFGTIVATIFTIALGYVLVWVKNNYPPAVLFTICGVGFILCVALGFLLDRKSAGR